jgi:hypothetical protein
MPATLSLREWSPSETAFIADLTVEQLRDMRKRGYASGNKEAGAWAKSGPMDVARLLLVKTMRDAGISAKAAWEFATDHIVANIVFRAVQQELRSLVDPSGALEEKPDLRIKFGREMTGLRAWAGGDFVIWGNNFEPSIYTSIEDMVEDVGHRPLLYSVLDLKELSAVLLDRAGHLGTVER